MSDPIESFGLTDVGRVRERNEDQFLIATLHRTMEVRHTSIERRAALDHLCRTQAHILVVADGVGGVAGGELASGAAVEALTDYIGQTAACCYALDVDTEHEFLEHLERAVKRAHEAVQRRYGSKGRGPATTLTLATLIWPRVYVVHVGDSRGYYLRQGRLKRFTHDQTMGEFLIDEGVMSEPEVERAGLSNVLASAIGADYTPSIGLVDLHPGDVLLLCTDGLTKHVPDEAIADILGRRATAEAMCRALVDAALAGGGTDNVTVVVARAVGAAG